MAQRLTGNLEQNGKGNRTRAESRRGYGGGKTENREQGQTDRLAQL